MSPGSESHLVFEDLPCDGGLPSEGPDNRVTLAFRDGRLLAYYTLRPLNSRGGYRGSAELALAYAPGDLAESDLGGILDRATQQARNLRLRQLVLVVAEGAVPPGWLPSGRLGEANIYCCDLSATRPEGTKVVAAPPHIPRPLERATERDAASLADIVNRTIGTSANCLTGPTSHQEWASAIAAKPPLGVFVIKEMGRIAGFAQLKSWSFRARETELVVYVDTPWRNGLTGARLALAAIVYARASGVRTLYAVVVGDNLASRRGIEAAGFVEIACLPRVAHCGGKLSDIVWYSVDLTSELPARTARRARRFLGLGARSS